jgi:hypothetical protein
VRIAEGEAVRGHEFAAAGPPVLFLHEPGRDLDAWGPRTAEFAKKGFKVLAVDLPGHGLSDGGPDDWAGSVGALIREIGAQWGPLGVVAAGAACRPFLDIGADEGVPVQAMISPDGLDEPAIRASVNSMRLVMCGPGDEDAHRAAKAAYDGARGQRMMVSGGGAEQGSDLIVTHPNLLEELVMWFRRYLTAYHLGWIKQVTSMTKE